MDLKNVSEISGLAVATTLCHLTGQGGKVFAEPPPIDIDELLPDEFFDWEAISIGEKEESKDGKTNP